MTASKMDWRCNIVGTPIVIWRKEQKWVTESDAECKNVIVKQPARRDATEPRNEEVSGCTAATREGGTFTAQTG